MSEELVPIAFFAFNRPEHTRHALEAIWRSDLANRTRLYAFCDGPSDAADEDLRVRIAQVREIVSSKLWCAEVVSRFRDTNAGLARSLLSGITEVVNAHGRVIVVEDDVVISTGFLRFMNEVLDLYADEERVMHVSGYSPLFEVPDGYPENTIVLNHTYVGWGWATWDRAWAKLSTDGAALRRQIDRMGNQRYVNLDGSFEIYWALKYLDEGRSQDWNAYWHASVLVNGGCCIHPVLSLAENIGFDGSGTQCTPDSAHMHRPIVQSLPVKRIALVEKPELRRMMTARPFRIRAEIMLKHWARRLVFGLRARAARRRPR